MTSEELLLEKWHELPEPQQKLVLAYVSQIHARHSPNADSPIAKMIGSPPNRSQPVPLLESERQRVMEQVRIAQADRPQRLERMKVRQKEGWEAARKVAQMLKDDFGVGRVVLFGSLLNHEHMDDHSDIDLAVWGLANEQETQAWIAANDVLSPYDFPPIDLVPIEKAYSHIKKAIETEGVEL